jgi:heme-degrading monooxygenase HmoA
MRGDEGTVVTAVRPRPSLKHKHLSDRLRMVTIGMYYEVLEGKEQVFEKAFASVLGAIQAAEEHRASRLLRDVFAERSYVIMSEWTSEQAFNDFIRSDEFARVVNWGKEQVLSTRPQHVVYRGDE